VHAWRPQNRNFYTPNASLIRMSGKQVFEEILVGIRSDLKFLKEELFSILWHKRVLDPYGKKEEVRNWILDVFLDKLFETHAKVERVFGDFDIQRDLPIWELKRCADDLAFIKERKFNSMPGDVTVAILEQLNNYIEEYDTIFEKSMGTVRKILHDQNWEPMKRIHLGNYVLPVKRARYIEARDELAKAKKAVNEGNWEEVLNHLRPAIDLAIKEKFGFMMMQGSMVLPFLHMT